MKSNSFDYKEVARKLAVYTIGFKSVRLRNTTEHRESVLNYLNEAVVDTGYTPSVHASPYIEPLMYTVRKRIDELRGTDIMKLVMKRVSMAVSIAEMMVELSQPKPEFERGGIDSGGVVIPHFDNTCENHDCPKCFGHDE